MGMSNVGQANNMGYLLIFDMRGNGASRRRLGRYMERTARRVQHSVWEFKNLRDLEYAAEEIREEGGSAIAFSRSDELLLHISQVKKALRVLVGNF